MPEPFRLLVVRKHLGPAPGWVPREYVEKHVAMKLGATITGVREVGGRAELSLRSADGVRTVVGDFVIAATGYRPISAGLHSLDAASAADCAAWIIRQFSTGNSNRQYLGFTSLA